MKVKLSNLDETSRVHLLVGVHHVFHDPGAGLTGPVHGGAGPDGLRKRGIDADFAVRILGEAPKCFSQGPVEPEIAGWQNHARVGAPPENRLSRAEPRKDGLAVGADQGRHVQRTTDSQQAGRRVRRTPCR